MFAPGLAAPCLITLLALAFPPAKAAPAAGNHIQSAPRSSVSAAPAAPLPGARVPPSAGHRAAKSHKTAAANGPVLPLPPTPPEVASEAKPAQPQAAKPPRDPNIGTVTGLPVPRYVSLRADAVNLRTGPGERYPIDWVYKRAGMPVEVLREFDVWRLVETPDGDKGWMHEATLIGRRDFIVQPQPQTLRADPQESARPVAILEPGVIGRIRSCDAGASWCRVQVGGYSGWLPRSGMWGLLPNEVVKP